MWRENERENDPCPAGWRIPRYSELENLNWNWQGLTTGPNGQPGVYYYGEYTPIDGAPKIFLPAAGCILPEGGTSDGHMWKRGSSLHYWTSDPKDYTSGSTTAYCLLLAFLSLLILYFACLIFFSSVSKKGLYIFNSSFGNSPQPHVL